MRSYRLPTRQSDPMQTQYDLPQAADSDRDSLSASALIVKSRCTFLLLDLPNTAQMSWVKVRRMPFHMQSQCFLKQVTLNHVAEVLLIL